MSDNEQLVHALRSAALRFEREIAAFGHQQGLGGTDVRALVALLDLERDGAPATPGALAATLRLSSAAATALVDRLAGAGLVLREPDAADRRKVRLTVTARARALGEEFFGSLLDPVRTIAAGLTPAEAAAVARFLDAAVSP